MSCQTTWTLSAPAEDASSIDRWISATTAKPKETDAPGSTTYNFDFTAKGGPKAVPAVFQGDKLSFPDGNAWTMVPCSNPNLKTAQQRAACASAK